MNNNVRELVLDDHFKITTDSTHENFILMELKEVENKKDKTSSWKWVNKGYFGRLEHVLNRYVEYRFLTGLPSNVDELLSGLNNLQKVIQDVVKKENITLNDFNGK